jgi:toxin YoeB
MMKVEWSPNAKLQLREILKFYTYRNGSPSYSKRIKKEIWRIIRIIRTNRHFGECLPGHDNQRRISVGYFVMIYEFYNGTVRINSIRDGRRDEE